jgi:hypothetical protein
MKFYNLVWTMGEDRYASASADRHSFGGPTVDLAKPHLISEHDPRNARRLQPLVIQWDPGSDQIVELVWVWDY